MITSMNLSTDSFKSCFGNGFLKLSECFKEEEIVNCIIKRLGKDSKKFEMLIKRQTGREQQKVKMDFELKEQWYYSRIPEVCLFRICIVALVCTDCTDKISRFCL